MAEKKPKFNVKQAALIFIILIILIIIVQNLEPIDLRILFVSIENVPKFVMIVLSVLLGMGIQSLINLLKERKEKK